MKNPVLLLQGDKVMATEKLACSFSTYPIEYCKYDQLNSLDPKTALVKYVPVGSVEFTKKYCDVVGIQLPTQMSYIDPIIPYLHRNLRLGTYSQASPNEFIKPYKQVKLFTGCIKKDIDVKLSDDEKVWISEAVPFESEYRFYIYNYIISDPRILGWARYDDLSVKNPDPDMNMIWDIVKKFNDMIGPNAYSIDIGWRPDIKRYSVIEINDGWSLGYYENSDEQSSPPTRQQYADMLVARWSQIVFCNLPL